MTTQLTTSSETLPFLQSSNLISYTPIIDTNGSINVVAGNCAQGADGTQLWQYTGDPSSIGNGNWVQYKTLNQEQGNETAVTGSNFLANGISFSQYTSAENTNNDIFLFGGQCPFMNSTANTWTSAANYSNIMLTLSPENNTGNADYALGIASSRGPPIPEAGFSITPLSPTYTASTANQPQKQEQDFVLLGGHTQTAFINMSQVAVFSLPQQTWTFLPVSAPTSARTDLSARDAQTSVEPRSGHTAVLTEDGASVIIMGGWVGDVNTVAEPQLATLSLGSGFGGDGNWEWNIPSASGLAPPVGGIYGHGAAMLPGGVMMVVGGYTIHAASTGTTKRSTSTEDTQLYFYNVSSSTWIASYTPPSGTSQELDHSNGALSTTSQKAGLGAGLAIGALILACLIAFYFWYSRRLRHAQEARGQTLLARSSAGSLPADIPYSSNGGIDGRGGDATAIGRSWHAWDHEDSTYSTREQPEMQRTTAAGSTALFVNLPSPTRGLRRGVGVRNYQYHAAPRYDDKRVSRGSGYIPPIAEDEDEDDASARPESTELAFSDAARRLREVERVLNSTDPFLTSTPDPLRSHPISPETSMATSIRRKPVADHYSSTALPGGLYSDPKELCGLQLPESQAEESVFRVETRSGRVSPSKTDERTSSTLSERSIASSASLTRTMDTRTGLILAAAAAARAASNSSPEYSQISSNESRTHTMSTNGGRKSPFFFHSHAKTNLVDKGYSSPGPNSAGADDASFRTAGTTLATLQIEGEALLGGRPTFDSDDPYQRAMAAQTSGRHPKTARLYKDDSGPPPAMVPQRRPGWMGSLRRALNVVSMSERSFSMTSNAERTLDGQQGSANKRDYQQRPGGSPRRAASDGSALLKHKRGQQDWADGQWPCYRDDPDPGDWGEANHSYSDKQQAEDEWDVEGAASKRDVQVMFTVPKTRLRIVNADLDRASLRSASDSALSRTNSVKNLTREDSVRTLRTRSEGHRDVLPSTSEEEGGEHGEEEKLGYEGLVHYGEKEKSA
ncbi:hypothetical protein LTR62_000564 [Meristemomyces frigidus]|uniref:Galactose oxidase n=1 Tax=Meristemomyces frigidus TaxID=1508187 RepID=A0AAN7TA39_9PEZI|nr:hypothetical protein LTR62_000564 [Meristemomyces frigidus]